jgi:DNA polymerase-3 subunit beta
MGVRLSVSKGSFVRSWQLAQTSIKSTPTITALGCVKCCAEGDSVTLMSTDLKTSVTCLAQGAVISEEGEAILPARIVGELIKKLPDSQFTLSAEEGKGYIEAGRSRYTFVTYPVEDFPILPTSETAKPLCALPVGDMIRLLKEGTFSGSPSEEFPQYLSAASIKVDGAKSRTMRHL